MAFGVTAGTATAGATTSPLSVSTPASVASGDLLLVVFESANAYTSITATGWTLLSAKQQTTPAQTNLTVMARIADGTEGASQSFTYTGTLNHWSGRMFRVTGHGVVTIGTDIVVGTANGGTTAAAGSATMAGITVTAGSAIFLFAASGSDANSTTAFSAWANTDPGSGAAFTEIADNLVNTGNGGGFGAAWGVATGTSTGTGSFTGPAVEWAGVQIGVKPPGGPTNVTGVALTQSFSLPAGTLSTNVTGVALTQAFSLPAGAATKPLISFVNGGTTSAANGTNATLDISSWGLQENDVIILNVSEAHTSDLNMTPLGSSGWTLITEQFSTDTRVTNQAVWYKRMGASPDTSITINNNDALTTTGLAVTAMAFRGVVTSGSPEDVVSVNTTINNSAEINSTSIDWSTTGVITVLCAAGTTASTVGESITLPAGYTTNGLSVLQSETTIGWAAMGYNNAPSDPEDPGAVTVVNDGTSDSGASVLIALKPAAQNVNVTGVALTQAFTLPAGSLRTDLTGAALTQALSLPAGVLRTDLAGVALTQAFTLPAGKLNTDVKGVALTQAFTLPAGGAQVNQVGGVALTQAFTLPAGSLRTDVRGVALTQAFTLPAGGAQVNQVGGVALTQAFTLPAGSLRTDLTGVALTQGFTLPAGSLRTSVVGVVLTQATSLPAGSLNTGLTGVALTQGFTLPAGSQRTDVLGVAFTQTFSLPAGVAQGASQTVIGAALTVAFTLPAGSITGGASADFSGWGIPIF